MIHGPPGLSIVVPVHDEVENLPLLLERLHAVLERLPTTAEIIIVDDASTDGSPDVVRARAAQDPRLRLVRLRRHAGLTAAFDAGFRAARGDIVVTLDADLQNDPDDIPALLAHLATADAVIGWRRHRQDPWLKRVSSRIGNGARRLLTGSAIHDGATSLRAMRRHCLERLWLLDGLHRFLPTLLEAAGMRVVEVPVRHHPRRHGRSKFGVRNRAWRGLVDLLAIRWLLARRLDYAAVEEPAYPGAHAGIASRAARRRQPARALAAVWVGVAALLLGWSLHAGPGGPTLIPDETGTVLLAPPPGRILSLWVWWDAPAGRDGWLDLTHVAPRSPAVEAYWRRRVHPGWNLLTWSDVPPPATPDGLALHLVGGAPQGWAVAAPVGADGYRMQHLGRFSGLLVALALAGVILAWQLGRAIVRGARPGLWEGAVGIVVLVALGLRLRTLDAQSLWLDEVLTAIGAQDLTWVLYSAEIFGHPPLQYLIAWAAGGAAGSEFAFRLPFVLAGVATIAAVAVLGRRLLGATTGVVAALALAISPLHIEISQTARPYAFLLLFTAMSLVALAEALRRDRLDAWLLFSATATLVLYSHYLGLTVLALQALAALVVVGWRSRRRWAPAMLSLGGIVLLATPWVPVLARLAVSQVRAGDLPASMLRDLVVHAWLAQFLGPGTASSLALALIAASAWALRRRAPLLILAALWLVLPLAVLWLAQPAHFVAGRHLAFVLPVVMLLMAHGVTTTAVRAAALAASLPAAHPRLVRLLGAAVAAALLLAWSVPTASALRGYYAWRHGHDWRTVAAVLDGAVSEGDEVLATVAAAYPLRYYWRERVAVLDQATPLGDLTAAPTPRRWIVTAPGGPWPPDLEGWLATHAIRVAEIPPSWSLPGVAIYRLRVTASGSPRPRRSR